MNRVLQILFGAFVAAALLAAVSACNTNGGIPAAPIVPTVPPGQTASPSPSPSPSPT